MLTTTARLSYSPPWLPRPSEVFISRSRTGRFSSESKGGCPVVLVKRRANFPGLPSAFAASAAAWIAVSERPASSSRVSTITEDELISFSTFWLNCRDRFANSSFNFFKAALSASESLAPRRTKSRW